MCNSDKRLGFFFNHSIHETIHSSTASRTVLCTHQVVSGSVHLMAPLDGAMKLLVVVELLLDGCLIVSPGSCFNQTLEHQTRRNMYFTNQNIWEKDRRTIDSQLSEAHMFSSDMSVVFSNTCLIWISCHQQVVAEKQIGSGLFFLWIYEPVYWKHFRNPPEENWPKTLRQNKSFFSFLFPTVCVASHNRQLLRVLL